MPILAECQECGKKYKLREDLAGEILPCKACGAEFEVPAADVVDAPPRRERPERPTRAERRPRRNVDDPDERPARPRRGGQRARAGGPRRPQRDDFDGEESGGSGSMYWIVGGIALAVVAAAAVVAVIMLRDKGDEGDDSEKVANKTEKSGFEDENNDKKLANAKNDNARNFGPLVNNNPGNNADNRFGPAKNNGNGGNNVAQNNNPGNLQKPQQQPKVFEPPKRVDAKPGGLIPAKGGNAFGGAPAKWSMQPDPPAEPIAFERKGAIQLRAPQSAGEALYPSGYGAVVAMGRNGNEREYREVWDLRTGGKIGVIGGLKLFATEPVLSPDGQYAAVFVRNEGIKLYDVVGKKLLGTLPLDDKSPWIDILDFAGPRRLVARMRRKPLSIWSVPDGKAERSITLPDSFDKESVAFSPGGKYIVLFDNRQDPKRVKAYDLTTGRQVAEVVPPHEKNIFLKCKAIAFSPDGSELAGLFEEFRKERLVAWDAATGQQVVHHEFGKTVASGLKWHTRKDPLQYFPDKSKWLVYGAGVVDRRAGGPVWTVPEIDGLSKSSAVRVIDNDRVLLYGRRGSQAAVITMDLPHEEIAKATDVVKSGGEQSDVGLPPLTNATMRGAVIVSLDGAAGPWRVQSDPAPKAAQPILTKPLSLAASGGKVESLRISCAAAARAVVSYKSSAPSRRGQPQNGPPAWLEVYDLSSNRRSTSIEIGHPCTLMAVSPDGSKGVVVADDKQRLDIYSLADKKHLLGMRPFKEETNAGHGNVNGAVFVDADHLLTQSSGDKLVCWKLPECKAIYMIEKCKKAGVSPGGKYVVAASMQTIRFFDAKTGGAVGDVAVGGIVAAAGFHPDGDRFAATAITGGGNRLLVWSMAEGKVVNDFIVPSSGRSLHFCGGGHVLIDNTSLVDLNREMVVWSYSLSRGAHAWDSPDARHWYLASDGASVSLCAMNLPDDHVKNALNDPNLKQKMILAPGMKVSLQVDLGGLSNHPGLTNEFTTSVKTKLSAKNIELAGGVPVYISATMSRRNTGDTISVTSGRGFGRMPIGPIGRPGFGPRFGPRFGGGGPAAGEEVKESFPETVIECKVCVVANGREYAVARTRASNYFPGIVRTKPGATAQQQAEKRQQDIAAAFFKGYVPPAYVFPGGANYGLGRSELLPGGTKQVPLPQAPQHAPAGPRRGRVAGGPGVRR